MLAPMHLPAWDVGLLTFAAGAVTGALCTSVVAAWRALLAVLETGERPTSGPRARPGAACPDAGRRSRRPPLRRSTR
jgi:hypothetical protein